jgi:PAS domain S-box-containing protein
MSLLGLLYLAFGIVTLLLLALYWVLRRQRNGLQELSRQVQHIAVGGSLSGRIDLDTDHPELAALATAVNHLLARASAPAQRAATPNSAPVSLLGDRVHEAVLIHGASGIVYVNRQFAALLGAEPADLLARKLEDLVPPDYAELVADNIRRRLAQEPAAERYEIDLHGLQGQAARLELSSWPIEHDGRPALLIIGVEILPTQTVAALVGAEGGTRSRARLALESLGEAIITTNVQGRVDYINPTASRLLGISADRARGLELEEVAKAIAEADRKLLTDPVKQALSVGAPVNLGRRALVVSQPASAERLVEVSAAPMRDETGDNAGAVAARCHRSAGYLAADVLPGHARCADGPCQSARVRAAARGCD